MHHHGWSKIHMTANLLLPLAIEESFKPRRLVVPPDCDDESFTALVRMVKRCATSSAFWTADLLDAATKRYGRTQAGALLDAEGFTVEEIVQADALCRLPERMDNLSLEHHIAATK